MAWDDTPPDKEDLKPTSWDSAPPTKEDLSSNELPSLGEALLRSGAQGSTAGLYDEMAASRAERLKAAPASIGLPAGIEAPELTENISPEESAKTYGTELKNQREALNKSRAAYPVATTVTEMGASIASMPAIKGGIGLAKFGKAALSGGATAAGYSEAEPGKELVKDVALGSGLGILGQGVSTGISKAGEGVKWASDKLSDYLKKKSNLQTFKALKPAGEKTIGKLKNIGQTPEQIGEVISEKDLLSTKGVGQTYENVRSALYGKTGGEGKRIGGILKNADDIVSNQSPELKTKAGISTGEVAQKLENLKNELKSSMSYTKGDLNAIDGAIENLIDHPSDFISFDDFNKKIGELSKQISFSGAEKGKESVLRSVRKAMEEELEGKLEILPKVVNLRGDTNIIDKLREAKSNYSRLKSAEKILEKSSGKEKAKNYISGSLTAGAGGVLGGFGGGDIESALKGAAGGFAVSRGVGLINKYSRPLAAKGLKATSEYISKLPEKYQNTLVKYAEKSPQLAALYDQLLYQSDPEYKKVRDLLLNGEGKR